MSLLTFNSMLYYADTASDFISGDLPTLPAGGLRRADNLDAPRYVQGLHKVLKGVQTFPLYSLSHIYPYSDCYTSSYGYICTNLYDSI